MKVFTKKGAVTAFYYLLSSDGEVTQDEISTFDEIGEELDPEGFTSYREEIIEACLKQLSKAENDDEYYDVLLEGLDRALSDRTEIIEEGITSRLLLWDMLIMAYSNEEYDTNERKVIRHLVRIMDIDKSVYLEMERIADTSLAVKQEYEWAQKLDRPYAEVRPIVEELEQRMRVLRESALTLISDEVLEPEEEEKEENSFDKIKASVE